MNLKTALTVILIGIIGTIMASFFTGNVLLTQSIRPFQSLQQQEASNQAENTQSDDLVRINTGVNIEPSGETGSENQQSEGQLRFTDRDLLTGWIPWIVQQASILVGALSLIVFVYAGVMLVIQGGNEEQLAKSFKMIVMGILGIALAGFSYSIVANVLALF